ncbi:MAG: hypothetical protein CMI31_07320 [Opitutae bacterium]|nr:hypothetical protein [Opitutae bacterium]|tara:strand:- start:368 stop:565 length:198 start_codon:yes stop_codon:yes gene_type:complete
MKINLSNKKMKFEQRPIPYTATSDDYPKNSNPIDWQAAFLTLLKWVSIFAGLGLSIYLGFEILTD